SWAVMVREQKMFPGPVGQIELITTVSGTTRTPLGWKALIITTESSNCPVGSPYTPCSWNGTGMLLVSTKKIVSAASLVTIPYPWSKPAPGRLSNRRLVGSTAFPKASTALVMTAPTRPDVVKIAVSCAGRMFPSVRPGRYFQCSEATNPGETLTRMFAVRPPVEAVAVSSFATVDTVHAAPTRPPASVGELPVTV